MGILFRRVTIKDQRQTTIKLIWEGGTEIDVQDCYM